MDIEDLRAAMTRSYDAGAHATWPDPHPDGGMPAEDEYSRCLDPGKYRIVVARVEAWLQAIVGAGLATVGPTGLPVDGLPLGARAVRVTPTNGAAPLTAALGTYPGADGAAARLFLGDPPGEAATLPPCGCDACDNGSEHLLDDVDQAVQRILSGSADGSDQPWL